MLRIRNYFITFAVVFAISAAYALVGMQDAKAQDAAYTDLIKRIEALESKPAGNVTAGEIKGLKIGLNLRHRYENRAEWFSSSDGIGSTAGSTTLYNHAADGQRTLASLAGRAHRSRGTASDFTLQRMRLSFDMDVNKNVMARVMFQDVRTFGDQGITGNGERTDVQEGYVQLRNLGDINPLLSNVELRVGRWQQDYGDQRQIGSLGWANQSRSYDGAKLMYKKGNFWLDVFAWQIDEISTGGVSGSDSVFGVTQLDSVLYGIYSQYKFGGVLQGNLIEPFMIVNAQSTDEDRTNTTQTPVSETRYSWGLRAAGKDIPGLGGFDYTVEPVWQTGSSRYTPFNLSQTVNKQENIDAFAIHAEAGYTFKNVPWTPRIGYAYSFASGDDDYDEGTQKTFMQISPTQHAHNGYIDAVGWQNMRDHQIHFNVKPTQKLVLDLKAHFFKLDEESDAWYAVGGGIHRPGADQFVDNAGNTRSVDDELGQEIDFTLKYKMFPNFGVVAGYSHFWAGDFIKDTGAGVDRGADWFYLQSTVSF